MVKAVTRGVRVKLTRKQVADWCETSTYTEKPHCWIGVDENESQYYFWKHSAIEPFIQRAHPARRDRTISMPTGIAGQEHFLAVFRELLLFASQNRLCP